MELTITNREALEARDPLLALGEYRLDYKTAYAIAKMKRRVTSILKDVEEVRNRLANQYGQRNEDGTLVRVVSEGRESIALADPTAFGAEWELLMEVETGLPGVVPIPLSAFATQPVTADVLYGLGPFLYDDSPADPPPPPVLSVA